MDHLNYKQNNVTLFPIILGNVYTGMVYNTPWYLLALVTESMVFYLITPTILRLQGTAKVTLNAAIFLHESMFKSIQMSCKVKKIIQIAIQKVLITNMSCAKIAKIRIMISKEKFNLKTQRCLIRI